MLVITGTQRSGTSLVARAIRDSGYEINSEMWDEEAQGGYENEAVCGFYRKYLGDPTFPFDDFELPTVQPAQFAALNFGVIKFSYLLMNPAFVMMWHKFRPPASGDAFLVLDRFKGDVIDSKEARAHRFDHDSILLKQDEDALRWNFQASLFLLYRYGYPHKQVYFPEEMDYLPSRISSISAKVRLDVEVWKNLYDPAKTKTYRKE